MAKSSGRNLSEAEKSHEDAEGYRDRKERYISSLSRLDEEIAEFEKIAETFDIYMQEYNAVMNRIIYTEGLEFDRYKEASKRSVTRAATCAQAVIPILNITILTSEGEPSKQLSKALETGALFRRALMEERELPAQDIVDGQTAKPQVEESSNGQTLTAAEETNPKMEPKAT